MDTPTHTQHAFASLSLCRKLGEVLLVLRADHANLCALGAPAQGMWGARPPVQRPCLLLQSRTGRDPRLLVLASTDMGAQHPAPTMAHTTARRPAQHG